MNDTLKDILLVNRIESRRIGEIIHLPQCYIYTQVKFANEILEATQLHSRDEGFSCCSLTQGSILRYLEA